MNYMYVVFSYFALQLVNPPEARPRSRDSGDIYTFTNECRTLYQTVLEEE